MKKLKILLLMGGSSAEHEVSLASGKNVLAALDPKKYTVNTCVVPKKGAWSTVVTQSIQKHYPDIAFLALHGAFGEDGRIQGLLECARIPYTGSGVLASALAMDKVLSARIFKLHGLTVPQFQIVTKKYPFNPKQSKLPIIVKPANSGSAIGVSIVKNHREIPDAIQTALRYSDRALMQTYIKGREVTCGILEDPKTGIPFALPPTEIKPKTNTFFDYHAKYTTGASEEITPAPFPKPMIKKIQKAALTAHTALGCRGMSRTDMIVQNTKHKTNPPAGGAKLYVLETNTIPGMTHTSLLPQGAAAVGIDFPRLLDILI